jgi:uncharacterized protein YndB with AHSA1/START domain
MSSEIVTKRPVQAPLEPGPPGEVSLQESDGLHTVTLVRELPHPRATVWDALTNPLHLQEWAPFLSDRNLASLGRATLTMIEGGAVEALASTVTRAEPPSVLEYTWGEDVLLWELEATPAGTRLTLRHSMKDRSFLAGVSAGWHICLVVADLFMQGRPFGPVIGMAARKHGWDGLNEAYAAKLGVPKMVLPVAADVPHSLDQPFVITRKLKAPRSLVWKAWSEESHFEHWWGPEGSVVKLRHMDFRPGGTVRYSWTYPGQPSEWGRFVFGRIVPEQTIQFLNSFANEAGEAVRAGFSVDWPLEVLYTVTFAEEDGGTTMTLRGGPVKANDREQAMFASLAASMDQGFGATFEALARHLSAVQK